jgi:hypothetical protein
MDKPGFLGAQRWECSTGHPRYFVFYEMSGVDAMTTPEYLELRRWEATQSDASFEAVGRIRPGFQRGVYEQFAGSTWPDTRLASARATGIAGYNPPAADQTDFADRLDREHLPALSAISGVRAVRRYALTDEDLGASSGMRTERPALIVACALESVAVAESAAFAAAAAKARDREHAKEGEPFTLVGRLVFTASAEQ